MQLDGRHKYRILNLYIILEDSNVIGSLNVSLVATFSGEADRQCV